MLAGTCESRICIEKLSLNNQLSKSILNHEDEYIVERGITYYIIVGGYLGETGNYFLRINYTPNEPPSLSPSISVSPSKSLSSSKSSSDESISSNSPSISRNPSSTTISTIISSSTPISTQSFVESYDSETLFFEDDFFYIINDYSTFDDDDIVVSFPDSTFTLSQSSIESSFENSFSPESSNGKIISTCFYLLSCILFTLL